VGMLAVLKRKAEGGQKLSEMFNNPNPGMREVVSRAFVFCLQDEGIDVTDEIVARAQKEADKYPNMTINQFVRGINNEHLRRGMKGEY